MSFFEEFFARRMRLRRAIGERSASLFEFAVLSGLVLGILGPLLFPWGPFPAWWGVLPLVFFVIGLVALDARRRRDLSAGADEEKARKRHDRFALAVALAAPLLGAVAFTAAALSPEPTIQLGPEYDTPEDAVYLDLRN
jgi:hypothetical protein